MDDGDLGKPISESCNVVDSLPKNKDGQEDHVDSPGHSEARYWFISAAFPMIAGTLGPVASAFSICALVEKWRLVIPPGGDIGTAYPIPDPNWLYAVNAVQLALALVANLFLLLNMTKRVRFSIAQPITITGWYVSAVCLIALVATAAGPLQQVETDGDMVWSQAFYYGLYAAILYFIVACLMSVTIWGANAGHYSKDFKLTPSQRTLMLQTIMFLIYLLLGALLFSTIEGWDYLDGVYWADVTLFTVGYGDLSPASTLGRALMMPYALIGITSLGLVIGSIRSMVLDRGKTHLDARALEKKRRHFIRRLIRRKQQGILEPIDGDALIAFPELKGKHMVRSEFERRAAEFRMMRKIEAQASTRRRWTAMAISTSTLLVLWLVGAKVFEIGESRWQGWSYFDAFYFAYTGLTTIGYGDLTPISQAGKSFFVFWSLLALPTMTVLISNAGDTIVRLIRNGTLKLGNLTILPGDVAVSREAKMFLHKATLGLFPHPDKDVEQSPPGFFGFGPRNRSHESDVGEEAEREVPNGGDRVAGQDRMRDIESQVDKRHKQQKENEPRTNDNDPSTKRPDDGNGPSGLECPKWSSRAEYHVVLISEICEVTQHLREQPPRKYTYEEWAWYLRLVGEDEASADTHRAPHAPPKKQRTFGRRKTPKATRNEQTNEAADKIEAVEKVDDDNNEQGPDDATYEDDGLKDDQENHDDGGAGTGGADGDEIAGAATVSSSDTVPELPQNLIERRQEPGQDKTKWSWVGTKSPLLDAREEAEWILDRLQDKLRKELASVADGNDA